MVRLRDIAERAGVSIGQVSRILNNDPNARAAAATKDKVLRVADELGYRPNVVARALRSAKSDTLGVLVPDITNPLFSGLLEGIEEEAERRGYTVLLGRSEQVRSSGQLARMIEHGRVDGFILQATDDTSLDALSRLVSHVPSVLVHGRLAGRPGSVLMDDAGAARLATEILLTRGHRRVALVGGLPNLITARRREDGYLAALRDHRIPVDQGLITRLGYALGSSAAALELLLSNAAEAPTGVVVANVNAAIGLLTAAQQRGILVPDDLSVITIHDSWICDHSSPPLTALRMPVEAMGRAAVRLLHERLAGGRPADLEITDPPARLIERRSVRTLG